MGFGKSLTNELIPANEVKLKAIHFNLFTPLFGSEVILILGYNENRLAQILDLYDPSPKLRRNALSEDTREMVGWMAYDNSVGQYLVYMSDLPIGPREDGTLTHELLHVVEYTLDRVGIKHELGVSNEVYTYLLAWLKANVNSILWKATSSCQNIVHSKAYV